MGELPEENKNEHQNLIDFINLNFEPAYNLGSAELTLTSSQFAVLIKDNFAILFPEDISNTLSSLKFHQTFFDGEMVWLICHKK